MILFTQLKFNTNSFGEFYFIISPNLLTKYSLEKNYILETASEQIILNELILTILEHYTLFIPNLQLVEIIKSDSKSITGLKNHTLNYPAWCASLIISATPEIIEQFLVMVDPHKIQLPKICDIEVSYHFTLSNSNYLIKSCPHLYTPNTKVMMLMINLTVAGHNSTIYLNKALVQNLCQELLDTTTEFSQNQFYANLVIEATEMWLKTNLTLDIVVNSGKFINLPVADYCKLDYFKENKFLGYILSASWHWLNQYSQFIPVKNKPDSVINLATTMNFPLIIGSTTLSYSELLQINNGDVIFLDDYIPNQDKIKNIILDLGKIKYASEINDQTLTIIKQI